MGAAPARWLFTSSNRLPTAKSCGAPEGPFHSRIDWLPNLGIKKVQLAEQPSDLLICQKIDASLAQEALPSLQLTNHYSQDFAAGLSLAGPFYHAPAQGLQNIEVATLQKSYREVVVREVQRDALYSRQWRG